MASISIKCNKCGQLAFWNYYKSYKEVTAFVTNHKQEYTKKHRITVKRED